MIQTKYGDLIQSKPKGYIIHGCNAQRVMGKGFAYQLRQEIPEAYDIYRTYEQCDMDELDLGMIIPIQINTDTVVVNAITQRYYKGHPKSLGDMDVSYLAIAQAFSHLENMIRSDVFSVPNAVHFPSIGGGLGGGDWDVISEIIDTTITCDKIHWKLRV